MPVEYSQGKPRPQVPRADELPDGIAAPAGPDANRNSNGTFAPGPRTSEIARRAALARHENRKLEQLLGLWEAPEGHPYEPYGRLCREWRDDQMAELAATVGGGRVGPGPASVISTAALQLGASRWLHDLGAQTGDAKALLDASRLADASRANVLSAHELAAKEAQARPRGDARAEILSRLGLPTGGADK